MLSSIGADLPDSFSKMYDYLQAKHEADEYLKNSGSTYSIFGPGMLTDKSGTGKISAGFSLEKNGEISCENVALTLIDVLVSDVAANIVFEILDGEAPIEKAVTAL
jgi:hypothetical protein